jgi:phosphate-selective porin OprO/OprP
MKYFKRTALASVINLALFGVPDAHADTAALERRIRELETRLEKIDQAAALAAKPAPVAVAPAPEVEKLTRKVNTLERKLEVQDEVTAGNFQKLPVFDAGADGFKITSQDKKHQVRIRGAVQTDARFFLDNNGRTGSTPTPQGPDSLLVRQARVWLEGYFFKDLYFKIMPDFAASSNILPDAYLDYAYVPQASLLVGKFKPSISLERLQGDADTVFMERAFPANLAPNRDVGIQLHGSFAKPGYKVETVAGPIDATNAFTYQIGVTNGTGDSGSPNNSGAPTGGDNKEIDGRLFAHPFQHTGYSWLEGFGLGVAGSFSSPNHQALNTNLQRTALGQSQFLDYSSAGGKTTAGVVTSHGAASRIYPQAYWYAGPFGLMGEYVASTQHLNGTLAKAVNNNITQTNSAFQIQGSYVVTGEDNTFAGVKPMRNFDPLNGSWGALQLATRWSELSVDSDTFKLLDPTKSASKATSWTLGANWFLNRNATIRLDYENVSFNGGSATSATTGSGTIARPYVYHVGNRPSEQVFATRFQLSF